MMVSSELEVPVLITDSLPELGLDPAVPIRFGLVYSVLVVFLFSISQTHTCRHRASIISCGDLDMYT